MESHDFDNAFVWSLAKKEYENQKVDKETASISHHPAHNPQVGIFISLSKQ